MLILLHSCCAPCSIGAVKALAEEGIKPDLYWYNPNIAPAPEYNSRLEALRTFGKEDGLSLFVDERPKDSNPDDAGHDDADPGDARSDTDPGDANTAEGLEPCIACYRKRLKRAALYALKNGYRAFTTTLLISPYQKHEEIANIGRELSSRCGIEFIYRDFRPLFRESQRQAKEAGYYMQKYCGCIFSEEERYCAHCTRRCIQENEE